MLFRANLYRGESRSGGGAWGAHAPPFGTEQVQNAEVYRALSARSYSDAAHISLSITASCPANIKHSNLQLPRDSSVAVPHIQRLIPKGRGSEKQPYDESPELLSSCHKFCVFIVVSDGLRSTLIWSKFSGGECPQTPLQCYALYAHRNCVRCTRRMAAPKTLHVYPPPLHKNLDPPLL